MKNAFWEKNWQIIFFNILAVTLFIFTYGHFGDVIVDSFREAYIPSQMVKGEAIYKNIFTIYAPFSYLFNALLFLIFGVHLKVLYFAGFLASVGILNFTYLISKKFLNKFYSLSVVLFVISACFLSYNVFNFIFPYSYGILYGMFFVLASIYFMLEKKFPLAYLLYSFAICSKYEFVLLLPVLLVASKNIDIKKNIAAFFLPLVITFAALFGIQKVNILNLTNSFQITMTMLSAKTLYWFYSVMGLIFRPQHIPIYFINFIKVAIPFGFMYFFRSWWIFLLTLIYFSFFLNYESIIYICPLILILFGLNFKKLSVEKRLFVISTLLISAKVFFAVTLFSYGIFFIPLCIISLFIVIPKFLKKTLFLILLAAALVFGVKNFASLYNKNTPISSDFGTIYTNQNYGNSLNELINYINKNTKKSDKVIVYPECLIANFMTDRTSDNKFYSLIPLYVETFGDELVIKRLEKVNPEYIIISNYETSNYYYYYFGQDYAGEIFSYIIKNYKHVHTIHGKLSFIVYKKKN